MGTEMLQRFQALFQGVNFDHLLEKPEEIDLRGTSASGRVIGYQLDNAFGDTVTAEAILKGYQEYVLYLEVYHPDREKSKRFRDGTFNIASLIAILRANSKYLSLDSEFRPYMFMLDQITIDCRDDMHEPDNQGITMVVERNPEFTYDGKANFNTPHFTLKREAPAKNQLPITIAGLSLDIMIAMLLSISL